MKRLKKIKATTYEALVTLWFFPAMVQAQAFAPADNVLQTIIDSMTSTTGRLLAIVAVIILGFLAFFGAASMKLAGGIIAGIFLIFGATELVDAFWA